RFPTVLKCSTAQRKNFCPRLQFSAAVLDSSSEKRFTLEETHESIFDRNIRNLSVVLCIRAGRPSALRVDGLGGNRAGGPGAEHCHERSGRRSGGTARQHRPCRAVLSTANAGHLQAWYRRKE